MLLLQGKAFNSAAIILILGAGIPVFENRFRTASGQAAKREREGGWSLVNPPSPLPPPPMPFIFFVAIDAATLPIPFLLSLQIPLALYDRKFVFVKTSLVFSWDEWINFDRGKKENLVNWNWGGQFSNDFSSLGHISLASTFLLNAQACERVINTPCKFHGAKIENWGSYDIFLK